MSDFEINEMEQLMREGEGQVTEFKTIDILSDPIHLAKEMVALANSLGGIILFGIHDDGTYEGMKADKGHELHIMNVARDRCDPPINPTFTKVTTAKGDVYVLKIRRYKTFPHAVKTKDGRVYFIRVGTTVREATPMELALLFESSKEEVIKKPDLTLCLIDNAGEMVESLLAKPVFTTTKKVKVQRPYNPIFATSKAIKNLSVAMEPYTTRKPSIDLVPLRIMILNEGQAPAQEITVFLNFPSGCELFDRHEIVGGIDIPIGNSKPTYGGLYVKNGLQAIAWADSLGNDLTMSNFDEIYVRFPAEEKEHRISARLVQNFYPPKDYEFTVKVTPEFREVIEEVYEEDEPKG